MIAWFKKKYKDIDQIHYSNQLESRGERGNYNSGNVSTIVILKDGRKGIVKPKDGSEIDYEKAILYAYIKAMNSKTPAKKIIEALGVVMSNVQLTYS